MVSDEINFDQPEERILKPGSIELEDLDPNIHPFTAWTFDDPASDSTPNLWVVSPWKLLANALYYSPADVTLETGDLVGGTVASVITPLDGEVYHIDEVTGTPGFDFNFGFTGITVPPSHMLIRMFYAGSAAHDVSLGLWNYTGTPAYDILSTTPGNLLGFSMYTIPIPDSIVENYMSGGAMNVQIVHVTGGNASHDIQVDYVSLVRYAGLPPV